MHLLELDFGCECSKPSGPPALSRVDLTRPGFPPCPLRTAAPWASDPVQSQNALSPFCEGFTSHCGIIQFLPSLMRRQQKLPLFRLILMATLFACVPNPSNKQTKKNLTFATRLPNQSPLAHVSPSLGAPPSRTAPPSRLLEPAKLIPVPVALAVFLRQGGDVF